MKSNLFFWPLLIAGILYGCEKRGDITPHHLEYSFQNDTVGWTGDFANGTDENVYILKQIDTESPVEVRSNENGALWLIIGTDSGFESITTIYYNRIKATVA